MTKTRGRRAAWLAAFFLLLAGADHAVAAVTTLPGPADAGRVPQREEIPSFKPQVLPPTEPMKIIPDVQAPEQSKHVTLRLDEVRINGMTVFSPEEVKDIYAPYIGHEVTLDSVWMIAGQLTERYRDKGYFLSRVTVPQQKIEHGVLTLRVIEGYIGDVQFAKTAPQGNIAQNSIVKSWVNKLMSYRPLRADQIEHILLELNDIPGVNLHATLEPMQGSSDNEGAVRIIFEQSATELWNGAVVVDNNGSHFLGPYETQLQAQARFGPGQRTTVTGLAPFVTRELQYGGFKHEMSLFPDATAEIYGSHTNANPGYRLLPYHIKTNAFNLGGAFDYTLVRQRDQSLSTRVALEGQNTKTDILHTPLTRDYVRALRLGMTYQLADLFNGQNSLGAILSQGIPLLGASPDGQRNLSTAGATPDFTKFNINASRLQGINDHWDLFTALSGQMASGPLYNSEQFGYGGQTFGRAYDNSEIIGDQGIEGGLELRYNGINPLATLPSEGQPSPEGWKAVHMQPIPYGFYDIGAVWNQGQHPAISYASGSSAGMGVRIQTDFGLSSNVGFAFPLTHPAETPLAANGKNPRYFMSVSYGF